MKKYGFLLLLLSMVFSTIAQNNTNNYSYVTIPNRFSFQKQADQYQLNSLLKFLMDKEGYVSFLDTERIPMNYMQMDCAGLRLQYIEKSSLLKTKLTLELYDCNNALIYKSPVAISFEKEYKKAYQDLIRKTFEFLKEEGCLHKPGEVTKNSPSNNSEGPEVMVSETNKLESTLREIGTIFTNTSQLSIRLEPKGEAFLGYVSKSPSIAYNSGELVCKLSKTSLPKVYKVSWKDTYGNFIPTIGYFDEAGNLKIDLDTINGVKVMVFKK
ncbi:MAG: hypothetical protein ACPHXR_02305 [Flavicella sp.]